MTKTREELREEAMAQFLDQFSMDRSGLVHKEWAMQVVAIAYLRGWNDALASLVDPEQIGEKP